MITRRTKFVRLVRKYVRQYTTRLCGMNKTIGLMQDTYHRHERAKTFADRMAPVSLYPFLVHYSLSLTV